jgi:hypothetical protein
LRLRGHRFPKITSAGSRRALGSRRAGRHDLADNQPATEPSALSSVSDKGGRRRA